MRGNCRRRKTADGTDTHPAPFHRGWPALGPASVLFAASVHERLEAAAKPFPKKRFSRQRRRRLEGPTGRPSQSPGQVSGEATNDALGDITPRSASFKRLRVAGGDVSSPLRRTDRCHAFHRVVSDPPTLFFSSPPLGRTILSFERQSSRLFLCKPAKRASDGCKRRRRLEGPTGRPSQSPGQVSGKATNDALGDITPRSASFKRLRVAGGDVSSPLRRTDRCHAFQRVVSD